MQRQAWRWTVDLTHPVLTGFGDIPGHPQTVIVPIHTHQEHGRSNAALTTSIHAGTHVDSPFHFFAGGRPIDRVDISQLCGRAVLLDMTGTCQAGSGISSGDIIKSLGVAGITDPAGWRLIFRSGWERLYGTPEYYQNNPHLTAEAAEWLVRAGVPLVGLDFAPDFIGQKMSVPAPAPVHQALLGAGVCILENLARLGDLPTAVFDLLCLPLRLEGEGGAPARVIALQRGDDSA
ncbi:MAG: cyclase family protein [Desulfocucumaceae bacterium]